MYRLHGVTCQGPDRRRLQLNRYGIVLCPPWASAATAAATAAVFGHVSEQMPEATRPQALHLHPQRHGRRRKCTQNLALQEILKPRSRPDDGLVVCDSGTPPSASTSIRSLETSPTHRRSPTRAAGRNAHGYRRASNLRRSLATHAVTRTHIRHRLRCRHRHRHRWRRRRASASVCLILQKIGHFQQKTMIFHGQFSVASAFSIESSEEKLVFALQFATREHR